MLGRGLVHGSLVGHPQVAGLLDLDAGNSFNFYCWAVSRYPPGLVAAPKGLPALRGQDGCLAHRSLLVGWVVRSHLA